jgi:hypothetical protein
MPAASAEKRARQRANKLSRAKPTTEPAESTAQTPEIFSPLSQPTELTPTPPTSSESLPPSSSINFETFVELADLDDVLRFCDAVASTYEGRNLKLLWDRAFEAGLDRGRTEERDYRDEMYLRGKAQGIKEAEVAASQAEVDLYRHGIVKGGIEERLKWTSAGHGLHCLTPVAILSDASIQTDSLEPSVTATCDASIQVNQPADCVDGMQLTDILKIGFEKGQVYGIIQEREQWETAGHSPTCSESVATNSSTATTDAGIQADFIAPIPQYTDTSTQSISTDIQTSTSCSNASTQTSSDFDPLNNAESVDLLCAFSAIAPSSTPLGLVWHRAFEAGTQASQVDITDDLVIPPHVDTSVQTPLVEPPLLAVPPQMTNSNRLDWAEDVESSPFILTSPSPRQPRDLSVLRSSSPCPFSSLQRRSKCQRSLDRHQSHRRHCPSKMEFPYPHPQNYRSTTYQIPYTPQKPKMQKSFFDPVISHQASCLNWESDPRLSDLSRSLKALGWIRAH